MVRVRDDLPLRSGLTAPGQLSNASDIDQASWLQRIAGQLQLDDVPMLQQACELVTERNQQAQPFGQARSTACLAGIGTADTLAPLLLDEAALTAAVLFRSVRENRISLGEISQQFTPEVSTLVEGTLAMGRLSDLIEQSRRLEDHFDNDDRDRLSTIYKMLVSVTEDVRVVLIKLAERTFAMRELATAASERQQRVAREILTIYTPLAHRLGIAQLKWELEDLAFRYLAPERYKEIASLLNEKRVEREQYIQAQCEQLRQALSSVGIDAEVAGRAKHIYSIYKKMKSKQLSFDQLYDIRAVRVLVNQVNECYHALGMVHQLWHHIPNQFDDYITNPKANGYRSLHTAVMASGKSLEVQIRTHAMHQEAELGVCAHFNYKERPGNGQRDQAFNDRLNSLRHILQNWQETRADDPEAPLNERWQEWGEFERIYVFSRDGDVFELPKHATVLDFAYYLHTEVGNHCYAARVNRRYVPLNRVLKTGEQIEILTRADREPSRDWLIHSLGYITTSRARDKLRYWFRQQDRSKNLEMGREMLNRELQRMAIHPKSLDLNEYARTYNVKTGDDVLIGLVTGDISTHSLMQQISRQLNPVTEPPALLLKPRLDIHATRQLSRHGILIDGLDNVEMHMAQCCQPVHGEEIAGFITLHRGVSIHRQDCRDFERLRMLEPERVVACDWELQSVRGQIVMIQVEAYDRRGLLKDVTQEMFSDAINIQQVNTQTDHQGIAHMTLQIEVRGLSQLSKLLGRLEQQPGIISARRQVT